MHGGCVGLPPWSQLHHPVAKGWVGRGERPIFLHVAATYITTLRVTIDGQHPGRSWLVLADGGLRSRQAKTAHGVIRYTADRIAAVVDREHAGGSLGDVFPELRRDAPIVSSIAEGLPYEPTSLLLGVAVPGKRFPAALAASIREGIAAGLEVANGMHTLLRDDPELVRLATERGSPLWDVRAPPETVPLFSGRILDLPFRIILTIGTGSSVGKMTTAFELVAAASRSGVKADFVATGQTGIIISGRGIALDGIVSDFLPGAAEQLVCAADSSCDVIIVEGQGSLSDPRYAAVTLGLLHGSAPHVLVLCHRLDEGGVNTGSDRFGALARMIDLYEQLAGVVRGAKVACIAVNPGDVSMRQARRAIEELEHDTGLPAGDVLAGDADRLWEAVANTLAS